MPLLLTFHPFPDATFGLWKIAEEETFFRDDLPLSASEELELALHQNPLRRLEWLAGRWLLHKMTRSPQRFPLAKDAFSKPFFPENQYLACSLSHSKGNVGALIVDAGRAAADGDSARAQGTTFTASRLSPIAIGCDIQVLTEKMRSIAHKFLGEAEKQFVESHAEPERLELLHLFWTAKESLYKAYGLKELDFRKHLLVDDIQWNGQSGQGLGRVEKGGYRGQFDLVFSKVILPDGPALITAICRQRAK